MNTQLGEYRSLLWQYLAPQRCAVALMAALLLASIGLQLAAPQVVRVFIDTARAGASGGRLAQTALLFLVVAVVQQALRVMATYWSDRVAWTATNQLRADLAAHLLRLDPDFHKRHRPGELVERIDGDVNALASFFSGFVVQLAGSLLLLIGVVIAASFADWRLGIAFALFTAAALGLLGWIRQFAAPHWLAEREQSAAFYGYVGEVLGAREDMRANGAIPYAMQRFHDHLAAWLPATVRAELGQAAVWIGAILIFTAGDALAYGLGGGLYLGGALTLGAVYAVVAYAGMLSAPIETIRTQLQDLQRADASIARVRELFRLRSQIADGVQPLPDGALAVTFCQVSFAYGDESPDSEPSSALDQVSFHLEAGQVMGLLGRTGSGKSTLARLLFRLYDPQTGEVRLGGMDLRRVQRAALRRRIALVTQEVQLFAASLRDNLALFDRSVADERLHGVLDLLGLQAWLARLPQGLDAPISAAALSAGEAQLIAMARAFLKDPGLVILDEATSRLDPATEALLARALTRLLQGRTAIIIAHRLETVDRADSILVLEQGRVVEAGPRERLAADATSRYAYLRQGSLPQAMLA
jgi:ABC-type multidrug transport system fused ATPase/permease subunit